jgi:hypothetical protein
MAHATQVIFSFKELAEVLVKQQDIHEGLWGIYLKFGIAAGNAPGPNGDLLPTAVVPVMEIGIQKFDEANSLTVDASAINPRPELAGEKGKTE